MENNDVAEFAKITTAVMANFKSVATEPLLDMWFDMAIEDGISIEQWDRAARRIIRERKYTSQPTYADFRELICGKTESVEGKAQGQVNEGMAQIRNIGSWGTPAFEDPITKHLLSSRWSWKSMCAMTEDENKWWAKEFIEAYQSCDRMDQKQIECGSPRLKLLAGGIGG